MLILLNILSLLGNYYALPLFFGVNFVFGSVAVLLIIYLFGMKWGVIAALISSSCTITLWNYPYTIVVFTLEALFVGFMWQRKIYNLLLLDSIFWLGVGLPLFLVLLTYFASLDSTQILLILLKTSINGVANASIASLMIAHLPLNCWAKLPPSSFHPSLRQILLNLIVAAVLLTAMLVMTINGWQNIDRITIDILSWYWACTIH